MMNVLNIYGGEGKYMTGKQCQQEAWLWYAAHVQEFCLPLQRANVIHFLKKSLFIYL